MAIIEISKIQVRRGQEGQTGVPQLAGGEFGWAADTERLYIGLKIEDGGAYDGNVRILTENDLPLGSNLFDLSGVNYVYRQGTSLTTSTLGGDEFERSIASRLDDVVSVKSFGAEGNGVDIENEAIDIAINNLFLNEHALSQDPAKELFFPAGIYNVQDVIKIPRNVKLKGEGPGLTIINLMTTDSHIFQTIDLDTNTFAEGMDTVTAPNNIKIEDMTLKYDDSVATTQTLSLLCLDASSNSLVRNVEFKGTYATGDNADENYTGISLNGFPSTDSIKIENCRFENLYYGVRSNTDITDITIKDSKFLDLNRGIVFSEDPNEFPAYADIGPRFATIENNRFERIERQAVFVGTASNTTTGTFHVSKNNKYINVGNFGNVDNTGTTVTSVILFETDNNSSIDDYFSRYEYQLQNSGSSGFYNVIVDGKVAIDNSHVYYRIIDAGNELTLIRLPISENQQYLRVKYIVSSGLLDRQGTLDINIGSGSSPDVHISDNYVFLTLDVDLEWTYDTEISDQWIEIKLQNNEADELTVEYQLSLMA